MSASATGHFIVIEGPDGSGKTTMVEFLRAELHSRGLPVIATRQPSDGPIGKLIRQELVTKYGKGEPALSWPTLALMFAADRRAHLDLEILPALRTGRNVICDRYDYSSCAYQSAHAGSEAAIEWIQTLNIHARRPDLTIVLDVKLDTAARRRVARGARPTQYEDLETQGLVNEYYMRLERHFPNDMIVHVDANGEAVDLMNVWVRVRTAVSALPGLTELARPVVRDESEDE